MISSDSGDKAPSTVHWNKTVHSRRDRRSHLVRNLLPLQMDTSYTVIYTVYTQLALVQDILKLDESQIKLTFMFCIVIVFGEHDDIKVF